MFELIKELDPLNQNYSQATQGVSFGYPNYSWCGAQEESSLLGFILRQGGASFTDIGGTRLPPTFQGDLVLNF